MIAVNTVDGVRLYDVKYDDDDMERGIPRDRITFIDRPPVDSNVTTGVQSIDNDESHSHSIISVLGGGEMKREDVVDVEAGELEGHTGIN